MVLDFAGDSTITRFMRYTGSDVQSVGYVWCKSVNTALHMSYMALIITMLMQIERLVVVDQVFHLSKGGLLPGLVH